VTGNDSSEIVRLDTGEKIIEVMPFYEPRRCSIYNKRKNLGLEAGGCVLLIEVLDDNSVSRIFRKSIHEIVICLPLNFGNSFMLEKGCSASSLCSSRFRKKLQLVTFPAKGTEVRIVLKVDVIVFGVENFSNESVVAKRLVM